MYIDDLKIPRTTLANHLVYSPLYQTAVRDAVKHCTKLWSQKHYTTTACFVVVTKRTVPQRPIDRFLKARKSALITMSFLKSHDVELANEMFDFRVLQLLNSWNGKTTTPESVSIPGTQGEALPWAEW